MIKDEVEYWEREITLRDRAQKLELFHYDDRMLMDRVEKYASDPKITPRTKMFLLYVESMLYTQAREIAKYKRLTKEYAESVLK